MLLHHGGGYEDIVNVAENNTAIILKDVLQHHIHQTLEGGRRVAESEGHAGSLIKSLFGFECVSVSLSGNVLPEGITDINGGKDTG